jgi:hypothetical protein
LTAFDGQNDFIFAIGQFGFDQRIALIDTDGVDTALARTRVFFEQGFFDLPARVQNMM